MQETVTRWGLLWHSKNYLDGERKHIMFENCQPLLFKTRREARAYADKRYGYIRGAADLKAEPHGWRFPRAIRVEVSLSAKADRSPPGPRPKGLVHESGGPEGICPNEGAS